MIAIAYDDTNTVEYNITVYYSSTDTVHTHTTVHTTTFIYSWIPSCCTVYFEYSTKLTSTVGISIGYWTYCTVQYLLPHNIISLPRIHNFILGSLRMNTVRLNLITVTYCQYRLSIVFNKKIAYGIYRYLYSKIICTSTVQYSNTTVVVLVLL